MKKLPDWLKTLLLQKTETWYLTSHVSHSGEQNSSVVSGDKILEFIYAHAAQGDEICTGIAEAEGCWEFADGSTLDVQLFNPENDLIQ